MFALWADSITMKSSIGTTPFNLVYGKETILPPNLALPSLDLVQFIEEQPSSSIQLRMSQILKLEEEGEKDKQTHAHHQQLVKPSFDASSISKRSFQIGDLVLKWDKAHDKNGKHTKFQKLWLGPFQIIEHLGPLTFVLQGLQGKRNSLLFNGLILKQLFSQDFYSTVLYVYIHAFVINKIE